ncbi:MAG: DUF488 domain-containing protein [Kiritimatiellae bacterium]|nr:DUF488 domain-containing protein [Kiritimatiellia bacterium]
MGELPLTIWTVGHSTRTLAEFLELLAVHGIEAIADVRRFPGSRKYPHFNRDALEVTLPAAGIAYVPIPELGGRRHPRPDSHNTVWRNESFRGYADFMETDAFRAAIATLRERAHRQRVAVMCSEAVWWRCHRSMIADYLKASGARVLHIMDRHACEEHPYTSAARVENGRLLYTADESDPPRAPRH